MFIENYNKFIKYYGQGRKLKLFGFFLLSLIAGGFEFLGIALIYPFILLITKPSIIIHTKYYSDFAKFIHQDNALTNAFILGFIIILIFIFKNLFMVFNVHLQNKFISNWKVAISNKFMKYYMFSPYKNILSTTLSEKIYTLSFLVTQTIDNFVFRLITLVTNSVIVFMILALLFIKFLASAIITGIFVAVCMLLHNKFFKKKLGELSQKLLRASSANNEKTMENLNNLKEIKILSAENHFYNDYINSQRDYNNVLIENNFYGAIPPYIVEIFIVLSLFILAAMISIKNIGYTYWTVASYAIIAAAIFRVTPSINKIQSSLNLINTSRDFVKTLNAEYEKCDFDSIEKTSDFKLEFNDILSLKNITFSYQKGRQVIKDLNIDIKKGEFIGIIGLSGAGKSTFADIIMGLLPIDSGQITIDETEITKDNFSALRKLIGYVPQQINILDGSFKRNIAWGVNSDEIDDEKIIEALKKAQLYDIVQSYEEGINAKVIVGTAGLSQGQKQRLAIARALYKNPEIIILDEATSSMDVETEHEITRMLCGFKAEKTIIAIAHRLSTLKSCDRLVYLKAGKIVDIGTFNELSKRHADFERLIRLSNLNAI